MFFFVMGNGKRTWETEKIRFKAEKILDQEKNVKKKPSNCDRKMND